MFTSKAACSACFCHGPTSASFVRQFCVNTIRHSLPKGWRSVIGLEIHAQIDSQSKLFSGSSTEFGSPANTNVSLFDAATPGTLPILNKKCVELAVVTALALKCSINPVSRFDRKHYFYADLPAGYQITQFNSPYARNGALDFLVYTPGIHKKPYRKRSRLKQIQLEQDSGKSIHDSELQRSLIDLNRAGVGLMEFVFEPDLSDGEEAAALVKELSLILLRLKSCSCKMEEGALRVDANVSITNDPSTLGVRTEIKNIGSIRGVANAINYEVKRQFDLVSRGGQVLNETRNWDAQSSTTVSMRDKEVKEDYRFMPEPNLPPLRVGVSKEDHQGAMLCVDDLQLRIPELPEESRAILLEEHHLSLEHTIQLVNDDGLLKYFWEVMGEKSTREGQLVANLLLMDFSHLLNKGVVAFNDGCVTMSLFVPSVAVASHLCAFPPQAVDNK